MYALWEAVQLETETTPLSALWALCMCDLFRQSMSWFIHMSWRWIILIKFTTDFLHRKSQCPGIVFETSTRLWNLLRDCISTCRPTNERGRCCQPYVCILPFIGCWNCSSGQRHDPVHASYLGVNAIIANPRLSTSSPDADGRRWYLNGWFRNIWTLYQCQRTWYKWPPVFKTGTRPSEIDHTTQELSSDSWGLWPSIWNTFFVINAPRLCDWRKSGIIGIRFREHSGRTIFRCYAIINSVFCEVLFPASEPFSEEERRHCEKVEEVFVTCYCSASDERDY